MRALPGSICDAAHTQGSTSGPEVVGMRKGPTFLSVRLDLGDLRAELRTCRGRTCRVDGRSELLELGAENDKKCSGQRLSDQLLSPNTRSLTVASRQGTLAKPRRQRCA